jgi:hypothetical protein
MSEKSLIQRRGMKFGSMSMKSLQPVLRCWQSLNEDSSWFEKEDAPWWYNERATLSQFAGAIWKQHGWVLEEFATWKFGERRKKYNGRGDIWFDYDDISYVGEAKQCWPILSGDVTKTLANIEPYVAEARRQAAQLASDGMTRLGMVFIAPRILKSKEEHMDRYLQDLLMNLCDFRFAVIAWTFPYRARVLQPPQEHHNHRYIYPGVILAITRV